ncbi:protein-glutamine gamma-glutamyltransferase E-like isoform X2 [Ambystoma mexicanum]
MGIMADDENEVVRDPVPKTKFSGKIKLVGDLAVGQDVNYNLILTNSECQCKTVKVNIAVCIILYTRKPIHELLNDSSVITLGSKEEKVTPLNIAYSLYEDCLSAGNMIQVRAVCIAEDNGEVVIAERDIILENPKLQIQISETAMVNKTLTVEVSFTNPLHKEVTDCVLTAEGSGLIRDNVSMKMGTVQPGETLTMPIKITPYKPGNRQLLIDFTCNKISNVKGCKVIRVSPNEIPGEILCAAAHV